MSVSETLIVSCDSCQAEIKERPWHGPVIFGASTVGLCLECEKKTSVADARAIVRRRKQ